ncbi:MAG: hypothetical protein IPK82_44255 [Polyangiaceae bacterium]|nr:hypothetical protein [Polyangiaceae bacterium]
MKFSKIASIMTLAAGLALSGCVLTLGPPVVVDGYEPAYYDGYVVYYRNGQPYHYVDGQIVWISHTDVHYDVLVTHYKEHARPYRHWYVKEGYQYKTYRHKPPKYVPPPRPTKRPHKR